MKYKWNSRKSKQKQHYADDTGRTICNAENGTSCLDHISNTPHQTKRFCNVCEFLKIRNENKPLNKNGENTQQRRDLFIHTWEWKQVRYEALKKNGGKCELCGRGAHDNIILNVDHIKPRKTHPELALTVSNLQVLCQTCNVGKGSRDDTDWRR